MRTVLKANKKGMTLNSIYPAVLTIVLIGIVLGIGIYILAELRTNVATTQTGSDVNVNVSSTEPTNTTTLSDASKDGYTLLTVSVYNHTGVLAIPASNYTFNSSGTITWVPELTIAAGERFLNISSTYTYDEVNSPEETINDTVDGLADFAGWIAVIVVVIAAAIVLGIVLSSFGRRPGV